MKLTLKPFGPVPADVLEYLRHEMSAFEEVAIAPAAALPAKNFNPKRGQYLASSLFEACQREPGSRVLGVTDADLYETGLNFVFGYSQPGGRVAVISLARLHDRDPDRFRARCVKEAVHEIGHTLGLPHDEDRPSCVMHFSRTLGDTDRKGRDYCPDCASKAAITVKRLQT
jgi:archaemetzincin